MGKQLEKLYKHFEKM